MFLKKKVEKLWRLKGRAAPAGPLKSADLQQITSLLYIPSTEKDVKTLLFLYYDFKKINNNLHLSIQHNHMLKFYSKKCNLKIHM